MWCLLFVHAEEDLIRKEVYSSSFFYVYIVENFTEYLFVFLGFLWAFVVK